MASRSGSNRTQLVVNAASQCFQEFGIAKSSMQNIARAAGLSRQALYRSFPNRQMLVDLVLRQRLNELVHAVLPPTLERGDFADAFLDAAVAAVAYIRATPDLNRLLRESSIDEACRLMLVPGSDLMHVAAELWQPILDWGRERGELRPDLQDDEFIGWTATMILVYSSRRDIGEDQLRMLFKRNFLPIACL